MKKQKLPDIKLQKIEDGQEEILIRYRNMTPELLELVQQLKKEPVTIFGKSGEKQYRIAPSEIYYFESVDENLFACTKEKTFQVPMTLAEAEKKLAEEGFFRCNKSFVLNINRIDYVTSGMGSRIDAALDNGEHVIISRHYSKQFRELLKKEEEV